MLRVKFNNGRASQSSLCVQRKEKTIQHLSRSSFITRCTFAHDEKSPGSRARFGSQMQEGCIFGYLTTMRSFENVCESSMFRSHPSETSYLATSLLHAPKPPNLTGFVVRSSMQAKIYLRIGFTKRPACTKMISIKYRQLPSIV